MKKRTHTLPEVNFSDEGALRHLHLGTEWIQGSMLMDAPTVLFHEYIQRTSSRPKREVLEARAEIIQTQWGLPAAKWIRVFKPMLK